MANLTTSANVDTLMQSATTSAFQKIIGAVSPIRDAVTVDMSTHSGVITPTSGYYKAADSAASPAISFSAPPATAQTWFTVELNNTGGAAHTWTIPSSFSVAQNGNITTVSVPAAGYVTLTFEWTGSIYLVYGDPPLTSGTSGTFLLTDGSAASLTSLPHSITFSVDGAGAALATGVQTPVKVPYAGTIIGYTMTASPSGSITFNIFRSANSGGLPTASIINNAGGGGGSGTLPAIASGVEGASTTLTNWGSTTITANDNLALNLTTVDSVVTKCTFVLYYK